MPLTTTSYAILGLLDIRPWSAYELAQQTTRSLAFIWPVSESQIYAEPKRLAEAGLVTRSLAPAGPQRQRQILAITDDGRTELRRWLASEPGAPRMQLEILLRCLFAPSGDRADLVQALERTRQDTVAAITAGMALIDSYVAGDNPFPERTHANILWMRLVRDLLLLINDWADGAIEEVQGWTDSGRGTDEVRIRKEIEGFSAPARARGILPET